MQWDQLGHVPVAFTFPQWQTVHWTCCSLKQNLPSWSAFSGYFIIVTGEVINTSSYSKYKNIGKLLFLEALFITYNAPFQEGPVGNAYCLETSSSNVVRGICEGFNPGYLAPVSNDTLQDPECFHAMICQDQNRSKWVTLIYCKLEW